MSSFELEYDSSLLYMAIKDIEIAKIELDNLNSQVNSLASINPPSFENTGALNSVKELTNSIITDINGVTSLLVTTSSKIALIDNKFASMLARLSQDPRLTKNFEVNQFEKSIYNELFNDYLTYGGSQMDFTNVDSPNFYNYIKLVNQYYPNNNKKEILANLNAMEIGGCGYITLATAIINSYSGKASKFKDDWGFDIYYRDRHNQLQPNVNLVAAAVMLKVDKAGGGSANIVGGTYFSERQEILENANINPTNVRAYHIDTDEQVRRELNNGNICELCASDYTFTDGESYKDARHSMIITGIKENGNLIVSTWGEQREIEVTSLDKDYNLNVYKEVK